MKHLFVVNPVAGGSDKSERIRKQASEILGGADYEVYVTRAPMDAVERIRSIAQAYDGELRVYACGGDGTLNECVNGAVGLGNVAVTNYPCGTGNDFIKMFGEDCAAFYKLEELIKGEVRDIDVINVNGRFCVNISSVGIDARIGIDVHKYSKLPLIGGAAAYIVSAVVNMIKGVNMTASIKAEGFSYTGNVTLVCACNGRFYGGSFNPLPDAMPDDGIIDFLVVKQLSRLQFFQLVGKYAKGRYKEMPEYITHLRCKSMEIEAAGEIEANVDGEELRAKHVSFTVIPGGVRFIFPKNMGFFAQRNTISQEYESNLKNNP